MTILQLKYFVATAKNLSFSETAKLFYMTQPAISHQISELEHELGNKLFHRASNGVRLTQAGTIFLEDAKRILDMTNHAKERLLSSNTEEMQSLKIAYLASPCKHFLPEVIYLFLKTHPQVDIELIRMDAKGISASMDTDQFDIYFSLMEDLKHNRQYATRKIHEDHYCLVCRADHPCLSNYHIDYDKLATEPFLSFDSDKAAYMNLQTQQIFKDLNFVPHIKHTYSSMEEILFAAESGLGIAVLPYKIKDYFHANLVYIPLDSNNTACAIGAAWKSPTQNPAIGWFMNQLNQYLIQQ